MSKGKGNLIKCIKLCQNAYSYFERKKRAKLSKVYRKLKKDR